MDADSRRLQDLERIQSDQRAGIGSEFLEKGACVEKATRRCLGKFPNIEKVMTNQIDIRVVPDPLAGR
jgi:hypothetical protein